MTTATTTTTNRTNTTDIATDEAAPAERRGRPESEFRAAARRKGLTMKELAALMGVSASYLSQVGTGKKPWTPSLREKAMAVLGEVPGQGIVYRQTEAVEGESTFIREQARSYGMSLGELADRVGISASYMTQVARGQKHMGVKLQAKIESELGTRARIAPAKLANRLGEVVDGTETTYIRERARALGMTLKELADRVGVSLSYMSMVARGHRHMGVKVQAKVEAILQAPVKVEAAECPDIDRQVIWEQMDALGISQNEAARRAGISSGHLSQIMNGQRSPSGVVLRRLHGALFQRTGSGERVMPAEVKVLGWKKKERSGMVVRGAGRGTIRTGGHVPWGAEVEYAFRTGYDGRGKVLLDHVVAPPISAMLAQPQAGTA